MEVYRLERPDAVVLDLNTPEFDGIAVLQQVRRLNRNQPVIICTGGGNVEMEKRARTLGANEIIEREIPPRRLIGVLNRLLDGPFPRRRLQTR